MIMAASQRNNIKALKNTNWLNLEKIILFFFILIDCENRHYGEGCNITCGHCLNNAYCHHESGACLSGCEPGYHGKLCKSCK